MALAEDPNLAGLDPFLHGKKQDPLLMNSALLESVQQKSAHHLQVIENFFAKNGQGVVNAAEAIAAVYRRNFRLFTMGNGG
jgi:D-sedoheptulose 7-phosphate isomerase